MESRCVKEHEEHLLEARRAAKVRADFVEHHVRAAHEWESGNTSADCREGNRGEPFFLGSLEAVDRGITETTFGGEPTKLHTRGMNDVTRFELPTASHGGFSQRDRANGVTFMLNRGTTVPANGASDPSAELQLRIGGVHHGINLSLSDIALSQNDLRLPVHPRGFFDFPSACTARTELLFALFARKTFLRVAFPRVRLAS